jgi:hypothetical protein
MGTNVELSIVLTNDGWQNIAMGHTHFVPTVCTNATLTKNGQWCNMKPIAKIMSPNLHIANVNK